MWPRQSSGHARQPANEKVGSWTSICSGSRSSRHVDALKLLAQDRYHVSQLGPDAIDPLFDGIEGNGRHGLFQFQTQLTQRACVDVGTRARELMDQLRQLGPLLKLETGADLRKQLVAIVEIAAGNIRDEVSIAASHVQKRCQVHWRHPRRTGSSVR